MKLSIQQEIRVREILLNTSNLRSSIIPVKINMIYSIVLEILTSISLVGQSPHLDVIDKKLHINSNTRIVVYAILL